MPPRSSLCVTSRLGATTPLLAGLTTAVLFLTAGSGFVRAADVLPVARWSFGQEESTPLKSHGGVHRDVPGPRPEKYPDFAPDNTAAKFDGNGARFSFDDPGADSPFDFTNGDELTLEAWVQLETIRDGENVYIIGKGRTNQAGTTPDNQNWALRVREQNGQACLSFLFATPSEAGRSHWHRWTTDRGFVPGKEWHHVAVSYRFGTPESIRAVIDGHLLSGAWDMGGATKQAPVVDDDSIWIGSSMGGNAGSSLRGSLDEVAVYRKALTGEQLQAKYQGPAQKLAAQPLPEVMPELGNLPAKTVLITLHPQMPSHLRWLNEGEAFPAEAMRWESEAFLWTRLPEQYDDGGIRTSWPPPVLMRVAADVALPPGKHQLLLRVRGLSRLWVEGEIVARAEAMKTSPNGEEPITPVTPAPLPGHRRAEHRQQEIRCEVTVTKTGPTRIILETLVGGTRFHPDPGEGCLAVLAADGTACHLLQSHQAATSPIPLTDSAVLPALSRQAEALSHLDDAHRRHAAASQDSYWSRRHDIARAWVHAHPAPPVPAAAKHPVDAFLLERLDQARNDPRPPQSATTEAVLKQVHSLLHNRCDRCHGKKQNGGLSLKTRDGALAGGDSGLAAVTPGHPDQSELLRRIFSDDVSERMPPGEKGLAAEEKELLINWVRSGADWPVTVVKPEELTLPPVLGDAAFLRRVSLDTIGILPDADEVRSFLESSDPEKRTRLIDRLLADERCADQWMGYWQDLLAENPTLINKSLNTTGPFRWFLYDSLRDEKPLDRMVTELVQLRGHPFNGGSAGFGLAGNNDAPLAAKGQILASAFLGIDLQCARCHDSPYHSTKQSDLFALAAMLQGKPLTVPASSRVPAAFFENQTRASLIQVSLKPDEPVPPVWPLAKATGSENNPELESLLQDPDDSRERLAALITSPANTRFAEVFVNRVWRRLMGAGLVEPPDDWEGQIASHPELLTWLARDFISHDYNVKHLMKVILTSSAYQREATGQNRLAEPSHRFFTGPDRRRMTAEQVVDQLHSAAGQAMNVEELTFDPDARRATGDRISLGVPRRSWMFASLANERDRPSLNLPRARAITDVLEAFGWSGARQSPRTDRETAPSVLQPGVLANGPMAQTVTRAVVESGLAEEAVVARTPEQLVDRLFLRYLGRLPEASERSILSAVLSDGFADRLLPAQEVQPVQWPPQLPQVTWSNHLRPEANTILLELEERAHRGPPSDPRFRTTWLERYQDVVWSIVNLPEFVWIP